MKITKTIQQMAMVLMVMLINACVPELTNTSGQLKTPETFGQRSDSINVGSMPWKQYFDDPYLVRLIDSALANNQELNIIRQEIDIAKNEVSARKGEYLPFVNLGLEGEIDKVGKYTRLGAVESNLDIRPGEEFPEPLSNIQLGAYASWEVDVWNKLRNAKKAAYNRYLGSIEGRNFLTTQLIAEIASTYYELLALDNQLAIAQQNIEIQTNALEVVKLQKQAARVTELAVRRFEAQLLDTKSIQYYIQQDIIETENRLNFLLGRYPQPISRSSNDFMVKLPGNIASGVPAQLLVNRPDIREAELNLTAAKLEVQSTRALFFPSLDLRAGIGFEAFRPDLLITTPESMIYRTAGGLIVPLVNRRGITAAYKNANAQQIQALYEYEQTVLNAYIEVVNQLSNINNLTASLEFKSEQVNKLTESVDISNNLFRSARADYMEVLLTQEEALVSKFELVDNKLDQMHAWIQAYRALGGGWQE